MAKITRRAKRAGKITIEEFRAWLSGVEDMQPENWCPTQEQWKKIREKIELIEDTQETPAHTIPQAVHQPPQQYPRFVPPVQNQSQLEGDLRLGTGQTPPQVVS